MPIEIDIVRTPRVVEIDVVKGVAAVGEGSGGHVILDETTALPARAKLSFLGAGVTAEDDAGGNQTTVTIPGGIGAAAAGTLTGTTLAANVVASSLASAAGGTFGTAAFLTAASFNSDLVPDDDEVHNLGSALKRFANVWVSGSWNTGSLNGETIPANPVTLWSGKEPPLGNPASNGYILSSTTLGVRSWIVPPSGVTDHTLLSNIGTNTHAQVDTHIASTSNPHSVTASQVGLGSVENTALTTWAGSTNIVTLGTITTGTVPVARVSGLGTLATQSGTFSGTSSGTNTGDQTNISGNAATVTTNANLTGHVTSTGNAAVLGSFTVAQLNTAVSDADVAILSANTFTGQQIISLNGAASTPPSTLTGTWFTGGSATTTKPQALIEPTGATSTAWSTAGTGLGVNAASGFAGNLLDLQLNGVARLSLTSAGALTTASTITAGGNLYSTNSNGNVGAKFVTFSTNGTTPANSTYLQAATDGNLTLFNSGGSTFGRLQFGGITSSFPALIRSSATLQVKLADNSAFAVLEMGIPKFSGTNTTGGGTALLATNCPATTASAPYTWIQVTTSDGSTAYIPAWK